MKHAICVIGYGSSRVLQETINHLDSPNIDFIYIGIRNILCQNYNLNFQKFFY